MAQAVIGQSLRITATLGIDITGASSVAIWYKKPTGTQGSSTATVTTPGTGVIYADFASTVIDTVGNWFFMVKVTLSSGNIVKSFGEAISILDEFVED
jgi:hypothetical protein